MKLPPMRFFLPIVFVGGLATGMLLVYATVVTMPSQSPVPLSPVVALPPVPTLPESPVPPPGAEGDQPASTSTSPALNIDWAAKPKRMAYEQAVGIAIRATVSDTAKQQELLQSVSDSVANDSGAFWDLGTVQGGSHDGWHVLYWLTTYCDPGGCVEYRLLRSPSGNQIRGFDFVENQDYPQTAAFARFILPGDFSLPPITESKMLTLPNGQKLFQASAWFASTGIQYQDVLDGKVTDLKLIGTTQDGLELFSRTTGPGCVYVFGKDHRPYSYVSVIPMKNGGTPLENPTQPDIKWTAAGPGTGVEYLYGAVGGCGEGACPQIVVSAAVGSMDSLKQVGTTVDGEAVYAPKDPATNAIVKEAYESWVAYAPDGTKPSIAEYIRKNPVTVFFWKDAFGRWVRYLRSDALPPVECGKPVIYLYPEQTTDVSVRLPSFITVTKSDPEYPAAGWSMTAHPDGRLISKGGSTYDSLYWEGTGAAYEPPKEGFIIKQGNVDASLKKILARYGLNDTESREFRGFWVPNMTGAAYYRVSFLTSEWSKAAPLHVSPAPATTIRIFMDWQKLNAPVSIAEPKIVTPVRKGFTLVEWGGLLRK